MNNDIRRAPELKFEENGLWYNLGSNVVGIRAKLRDKKMLANNIINNTNIFTGDNALH